MGQASLPFGLLLTGSVTLIGLSTEPRPFHSGLHSPLLVCWGVGSRTCHPLYPGGRSFRIIQHSFQTWKFLHKAVRRKGLTFSEDLPGIRPYTECFISLFLLFFFTFESNFKLTVSCKTRINTTHIPSSSIVSILLHLLSHWLSFRWRFPRIGIFLYILLYSSQLHAFNIYTLSTLLSIFQCCQLT